MTDLYLNQKKSCIVFEQAINGYQQDRISLNLIQLILIKTLEIADIKKRQK